jgi:hypothetical protein
VGKRDSLESRSLLLLIYGFAQVMTFRSVTVVSTIVAADAADGVVCVSNAATIWFSSNYLRAPRTVGTAAVAGAGR